MRIIVTACWGLSSAFVSVKNPAVERAARPDPRAATVSGIAACGGFRSRPDRLSRERGGAVEPRYNSPMPFPTQRLRRLRASEALRGLVRETRVHPGQFILPLF